jgi:hypothetical protein
VQDTAGSVAQILSKLGSNAVALIGHGGQGSSIRRLRCSRHSRQPALSAAQMLTKRPASWLPAGHQSLVDTLTHPTLMALKMN